MKRREFLKVSMGASMAFAGSSILGCATTPLTSRDESVVVIGAGIAGISAARQLEAAGYRVTVLEASRRIGGRIYTNRDLGVPIELGASRVHGTRNNPLIPMFQLTGTGYIQVDWNNLAGAESDGTPLDTVELSKVRDRIMGVFRRAFFRNLLGGGDFPIEQIVQRELNRRELTRTERRIFYFGITSAEMTNASSFAETSWKYVLDYQAFAGGDYFITNGYDAVTNMLATNLDIQTGVKVTKIDYAGTRVKVDTDSGIIQADRVVITVPLGVLKANDIAFTPELSADKQDAIVRMGMGLINKVAIRFPKVFWPAHVHALAHGTDNRGEFQAFVNIAHYTGDPILVAFVPGWFQNGIEELSDADATASAVEVLRRMYGSSVPDPEGSIRTRWGAHPFTRGSYSFNKIGATTEDRRVLAAPVADRLFFAGEATSINKFGSVSGAYLTGIRAADEIVKLKPPIFT